ncbi:hypothetical protein AAF712_014171 [Marasmius tenuissimus]|uniref:Uncharacterized protein n=1 Tax=Marasmius tenuissimus TaxID=585030 RepID=A0ABR2ZBP5_9AGAR
MVNLRRSLQLQEQAQKLVAKFFKPTKKLENTQEVPWNGSMAALAVWRHMEADDEFQNRDPDMLSADPGSDSELDALEEGRSKHLSDRNKLRFEPLVTKLPVKKPPVTDSKKRKRNLEDGSGGESGDEKAAGKGKGNKKSRRKRKKKKKGMEGNSQAEDRQEERKEKEEAGGGG